MTRRHFRNLFAVCLAIGVAVSATGSLWAFPPHGPGGSDNGDEPITQQQIADKERSLTQIRIEGLRMFSVPFTRLDGYGDGPMNLIDTVSPGGRPTLQGNGTFLRVNGLDGQACLECHTQVSAATFPPTLGIGGAGGSNANAIIMPTDIDPADLDDLDSAAGLNGRFANPPFVFGIGGVELVALEMTEDLQALKAEAIAYPGVPVTLEAKGVHFGTLVADIDGNLDTSGVEGVKDDLVIRPFGRKGEFASIRDFDIGAMQFHFGMQPVEVFGEDVDDDGDGVMNEVTTGELSALNIFIATIDRPFAEKLRGESRAGFMRFKDIGCASCHVPVMQTRDRKLPLRFPEVHTDPRANVFYNIDLTKRPARFKKNSQGGVSVPMFADLKRHDMGPDLAETFAAADDEENRVFTTAKLWGVADSSPYMHDGRATTIADAILMHGGDALEARDAFANLTDEQQEQVLAFLGSLRTPKSPLRDLLRSINRPREATEGADLNEDEEPDFSEVPTRVAPQQR